VFEDKKESDQSTRRCGICGEFGHWASDCTGERIDKQERKPELMGKRIIIDDLTSNGEGQIMLKSKKKSLALCRWTKTSKNSRMFRSSWTKFQFLSIPILREYFAHEFSFDGTRLMSDHFLPHLPALSITKDSIDQMILLYQKLLPQMGTY